MNTQTAITFPTPRFVTELSSDPSLRSVHTRKQYAFVISKFQAWQAGRPLTVTLLESYLSQLQQQGASQSTVKQSLAAVRWLARRAVKIAYEEQYSAEAESLERDVERLLNVSLPPASKPLPTGRHLEETEISALLSACEDGTLSGIRDGAMIALASATAIRNEELRELKFSDLEYLPDGGIEITIRHGKGDKPRIVELYGKPMQIFSRWIEKRGTDGEYIFVRIRKGEQIDPRSPLSYEGTRQILFNRFSAAGLSEKMTWHDFRRTTIGKLFDHNNDISTIMDITGHANPETAKRYDRRPSDRRRQALREIQGT